LDGCGPRRRRSEILAQGPWLGWGDTGKSANTVFTYVIEPKGSSVGSFRSSAGVGGSRYGAWMFHQSSSHEQQSAEAVILSALSVKLGTVVAPRSLYLPGGAQVDVDGVADEPLTFVEVFAHQGALKGGQIHKVSTDALKLVTLGRAFPTSRLILAFADEAATRTLLGRGWKAEALRTWQVEVFVAEVDEEVRAGLRDAQLRQRMVNP